MKAVGRYGESTKNSKSRDDATMHVTTGPWVVRRV